jgi:site-specific recombinase XerD
VDYRHLGYDGHVPAANTVRAYRADWVDFQRWCANSGVACLPATPAMVTAYVTDLAGSRRWSTVVRRLAAIAAVHREHGWDSPTGDLGVRVRAAAVRHQLAGRPTPTDGLDVGQLERVVVVLPSAPQGVRDRAMLLVGYGAALRRAELVGLDVDSVSDNGRGLTIAATNRRVFVPYGSSPGLCSATAWHACSALLDDDAGPAFRPVDRFGRVGPGRLSPQGVTLAVKRATGRAGLDPARSAAGSLRRGMVGAATSFGGTDRAIMAHTGHRTRALVRSYMRAERSPTAPA